MAQQENRESHPGRSKTRNGRDQRLAEISTEQGGVVSLEQLEESGVSRYSASRRSGQGSLHRIHRGVYLVGHRSISSDARLRAALLACGDGAVISHGTAAAFWGLRDGWPTLIDVTVPGQGGRKLAGIRCRRCRYPTPEELVVDRGVACTTPARVLVDLAGMVGLATLRRTVRRAGVMKLLDLDEVDLAIDLAKGRPGLRALQLAISPWRREDGTLDDVRSDFEALAMPPLLEIGGRRPECNVPVEVGGERLLVDFLWQRERVIVETDGRQTHETPVAFQNDRRRDQFLVAAGYRVLRITWVQIHTELNGVVTRIAQALQLSGFSPPPSSRAVL